MKVYIVLLVIVIYAAVATPIMGDILGLDAYFKPVNHTFKQCFGRAKCMNQLVHTAQNENVTWVGIRFRIVDN